MKLSQSFTTPSSRPLFKVLRAAGMSFASLATALGLIYAFMQAVNVRAAPAAQETPPAQVDIDQAVASDLQVETSVNNETARPGDTITFTVRYTNSLAVAITNVTISDTISRWQTFSGEYASSPNIPVEQFSYSGSDSTGYALSWQIPLLPPQSSGEITFRTVISPTNEPAFTKPIILVGNAVAIRSSQTSPPVSGAYDDAVTMVMGPLLSLSKTADASVLPGHILTYTLTVVNNSRSDAIPATNLLIVDSVPNETAFLSANNGGVYDPVTNQVSWLLPGPLQPGGSLSMQFAVLVNERTTANDIRNSRIAYSVTSAEVQLPVYGTRDITTPIASLLQKTVVDKNGGAVQVFPTEEVTYTITVYNPLSVTLMGVVVTDTMPGDPEPFTFVRAVPGSPAPTIVENGRKLVWQVDLLAWGSVSFSFVARIPRQTYIRDNWTDERYYNTLSAYHPQAYFETASNLAEVRVYAALIMDKQVTPNHGLTGDVVTYTINLTNRSTFVVSNIRLTDTLPADFHYLYMVSGPAPLPEYRYNPVVWAGLTVQPGQTYQLIFAVVVDGNWLTTYGNNLSAYSPDAFIPRRTNIARVTVDPPLAINKTVQPTIAYLGSTIRYDLQLTNRSDVTWTMDWLRDDLPDGFYQVGGSNGNIAELYFIPPVAIPPGGVWSGAFNAQISDVNCSLLPRTYPNAAGAISIHTVLPESLTAVNASNLAPVVVEPNIKVDLVPYRYAVLAGGIFTYTLHLNNVSPTAASNSTIVVTLPADFSYAGSPPGQLVPSVNGQQLTWTGINLPGNSQMWIVFRVQVGAGVSTGVKTPTLSATSPSYVCFGRLGSGDHPQGDGRVLVVLWGLELSKRALRSQVPPLALVDFEITLKNNDAYDFIVATVTDTLPTGFTYYSMVSGPLPSLVQPGRLVWRNVLIPPTDPKWTVRLQSSPLYGTYQNRITAYSSETNILPGVSGFVSVSPLFDLKKDVRTSPAIPGTIVPYTITLVNQSQSTYSSILVTDTLPAGFTYLRTRSGPTPISLGPNNGRPVWSIPELRGNCTGGCAIKLAFDVFIHPLTSPGVYYNRVIGSSPSGSVPGPINTAPLTITQAAANVFLPVIVR